MISIEDGGRKGPGLVFSQMDHKIKDKLQVRILVDSDPGPVTVTVTPVTGCLSPSDYEGPRPRPEPEWARGRCTGGELEESFES